jgi:uncharacterized protein (DUF1697 family)
MPSVVFLRAVNVGGHQKFRPSALAKDLAEYGVVNIGAAGTFIVREAVKTAVLKEQIERRLHFKPEMIICSAPEILALCDDEQFKDSIKTEEVKPFVTVLAKVPRKSPRFPIEQPAGEGWQVRVIGIRGRFVLSLYRKLERMVAYPNNVVEKKFNLPATTRTWSTIAAVYKILEQDLMAEVF